MRSTLVAFPRFLLAPDAADLVLLGQLIVHDAERRHPACFAALRHTVSARFSVVL